MKKGYDFDDLLLVPQNTDIVSRDEVDTSVILSEFLTLKIPVIGSPMKGIINRTLVELLSDAGGIGILHRFYTKNLDLYDDVLKLENGLYNFGVAVSSTSNIYDFFIAHGAKIICIDVADGYISEIYKKCNEIKTYIEKNNYNCLLLAGNVATADGAKNLVDVGVDLLRVGIGSGQLCTTRNNTGVGVPQLTAINDCYKFGLTVADGGIRNSGDAVKALATGADVVMIGSLLAKCHESDHNGIIYGMASRKLQEEYYHSVRSVEGLEAIKEKTMSFQDFISEFMWNIRSGMVYCNARSIDELFTNAQWIEVGTGSIKTL